MNDLIWDLKHYKDLTKAELYGILQLRSEVFVVEQQCHYLDLDNLDQDAWHLFAFAEDICVAHGRIIQANVVYDQASIGRLVLKKNWRGRGLGKALIELCLESVKNLYQESEVCISAQYGLEKYYAAFGFKTISKPYLDAGILHVKMLLQMSDD